MATDADKDVLSKVNEWLSWDQVIVLRDANVVVSSCVVILVTTGGSNVMPGEFGVSGILMTLVVLAAFDG
jgi:hypothetical protein